MKNTVLPVTFLFWLICSEIKKEKAGSYEAGFKIIQTLDKSRIYKPATNTTDYLHYRPLDLDIWYPAVSATTDSVLLFGDILHIQFYPTETQ